MVHISEYYFCHLFKEHMGMTFLAYLNDVRIHKAAQLLKNTNLSITRIAAETGYNDVNYFCRIFRKKMNRSPGNYRKG